MKKRPLKNVRRSIRTHFGILTSSILLSLLLVFYLGGRYIMINIIRQAEKEVTSVSNDIKRIISHQSISLQAYTTEAADACAGIEQGEALSTFLRQAVKPAQHDVQTQMAALLNPDGSLREGYYIAEDLSHKPIEREMLSRYFNSNSGLAELYDKKLMPISGVISFQEQPYYISIAPVLNSNGEIKSFLCVGSAVHGNHLYKQMTEIAQGLTVYMNEKREADDGAHEKDALGKKPAPIFDHDQLFAAGSKWYVGSNEFEAVIPIYDILGKEISSLSIRFPHSFASLITIALGWLTVFVAVVGMVFIAPVFWLQGRIILDPLSKLESQIQEIDRKYKDDKIEYLNYKSDDEFGRVARSVDNLLRELNSRSREISSNAQRQRALISGMPECLCIFNRSSALVSLEKHPDNAPPIPGLKPNKILSSKSFKDDSIVRFEKTLTEAFKSGEARNTSLICRDVNNKLRYFETRITRMNEHFALVVFRDVTQDLFKRKKQEKIDTRASKAQQMSTLGNLAAGIAHDFNNVLTIIKNTLEVQLSSGEAHSLNEGEAVTSIKEAASRGSALVQELMTYAGQTRVNMIRKNPVDLITELTPLYKGVVHPGINLEISHGPELHDVMVDTDQFWKVIVNLVKNAAESIKSSHGYIKISTYNYELTTTNTIKFFSSHPLDPDKGVIFEVADNGGGIPQEIMDRLFEPFFSTKAVSRGLGLATVFGIVDSHNGGIGIVSHENIGTKFRVWLPATEEIQESYDIEEPEQEPSVNAPHKQGTVVINPLSPCVLIIDDDASIIKTTALLLNHMGIETLTAKSRTEAAARFRKYHNRVNLVLMDAQLGNLDSVRLLSTLRMTRENLPVVICSGHSKEQVERMFENSNIDGVLIKPYTMVELREMLSKFVTLQDI